jgi:transcriptional regulator with XRE-family HTH domain
MDDLAKQVGANIRKTRKDKGYSQEGLALSAKLDRSYVGRSERGEANITLDILYQLARAMDCDAKDLLP